MQALIASLPNIVRNSFVTKKTKLFGRVISSPYLQPISIRQATLPTKCNLDLKGRVALVTGGTDGIGLEIARRLGKNGAKVVVSSRKQAKVDKAVKSLEDDGLEASGFACHVANEHDRKNLFAYVLSSYGDINIFVQNAGVNPHPFDIMKTPESALDKTYQLHVKANFQAVQELFPHMKKSQKPCSIVLTSTATAYVPHVYPGIYAVSKIGVNTMVRAFAPSLIEHNVRINCVTIGAVDTEFMADVKKNKETNLAFSQRIPMGRFGKAEEVAGLTAYLVSDDASYITGDSFSVIGGGCIRT